jgi:hypothetical protein
MISFAQKPGVFSYWVKDHRYTKLAGRIVLENLDVVGYGRFQSADLLGLWNLPFIKIFKDGDYWCALVGGNLQDGIAEFKPIEKRNEFDQITDFGHEYACAHPEIKWRDRFEYWLPHEIEMMAEQSRSRASSYNRAPE